MSQQYTLYREQIEAVFEVFKEEDELLREVDMESLVKSFTTKFKETDGMYTFTEDELYKFIKDEEDKALAIVMRGMVKEGKMDVYWDEDHQDFAFKLSDEFINDSKIEGGSDS